jgi:hypothetical protein
LWIIAFIFCILDFDKLVVVSDFMLTNLAIAAQPAAAGKVAAAGLR